MDLARRGTCESIRTCDASPPCLPHPTLSVIRQLLTWALDRRRTPVFVGATIPDEVAKKPPQRVPPPPREVEGNVRELYVYVADKVQVLRVVRDHQFAVLRSQHTGEGRVHSTARGPRCLRTGIARELELSEPHDRAQGPWWRYARGRVARVTAWVLMWARRTSASSPLRMT